MNGSDYPSSKELQPRDLGVSVSRPLALWDFVLRFSRGVAFFRRPPAKKFLSIFPVQFFRGVGING